MGFNEQYRPWLCVFGVLNPHQWSLAKRSSLKLWKVMPKMPKQAEAKRDGVINPENYNFNRSDAVKTLRIYQSRP